MNMPGRLAADGLSDQEWALLRRLQMALFGDFLDMGLTGEIAGHRAVALGIRVRLAIRDAPEDPLDAALRVVRDDLENRAIKGLHLEEVYRVFTRSVTTALHPGVLSVFRDPPSRPS